MWPDARGITYRRLDAGGLQWPCPSEDHPGTQILYEAGFPIGRAPLRVIEYRPSPEVTTPEFPFLLTTGRALYQFNAGTMTGRSQTHGLRPTDALEISAADADRLGLYDGERVTLVSQYGRTSLPLVCSSTGKPGELFATFHRPAVFLNEVTGPHRDTHVETPEYKLTAVRIEKMP